MREIKFRAWDKEYEKMTYFDDEDYEYEPPLVFRLDQVFKKDSNYDDYEDFEYNDITDVVEVMQYTGLHDKNGKEIYEGDIVFIDAYTYEGPEFDGEYLVKYNELLGMWTLINIEKYNKEKEDFITFEDLNGWYKLDIKLLGNIYENKELLDETNR